LEVRFWSWFKSRVIRVTWFKSRVIRVTLESSCVCVLRAMQSIKPLIQQDLRYWFVAPVMRFVGWCAQRLGLSYHCDAPIANYGDARPACTRVRHERPVQGWGGVPDLGVPSTLIGTPPLLLAQVFYPLLVTAVGGCATSFLYLARGIRPFPFWPSAGRASLGIFPSDRGSPTRVD
jgi:hypothetical protein